MSDPLQEARLRALGWQDDFAKRAPEGPLEEDLLQASEDVLVLAQRVEEVERALQVLVAMRDRHVEIYGYEKQHYIIDAEEWEEARQALRQEGER